MSARCISLQERSRRWGLCGTTGFFIGFALALMGIDSTPELRAAPLRQSLEVRLMTAQRANAPAARSTTAAAQPQSDSVKPDPVPPVPVKPSAPQTSMVKPLKPATPKAQAAPHVTRRTPERPTQKKQPDFPAAVPPFATVAKNSAPPTSGDSASSHATQAARAEEQQALLARLLNLVEQHKRYPPAARKLGLEGVVRMQVRVDTQGRITQITLLGSDAHAMLCKSGMESLRKVQNIWTAQPMERETTLVVVVRYALTK